MEPHRKQQTCHNGTALPGIPHGQHGAFQPQHVARQGGTSRTAPLTVGSTFYLSPLSFTQLLIGYEIWSYMELRMELCMELFGVIWTYEWEIYQPTSAMRWD